MTQPFVDAAAARAPSEGRARPVPATGASALLIFNSKAGSVARGDEQRLAAAVAAAGIEQHTIVSAERISRRLFQRAQDVDVVIVLGGDGTARWAAELAPRGGPPLVLLPGGTLNVLPHALYGNLAWPEALKAALERGVIRRLVAGRANERKFYVGAFFGPPAMLARAREAVRNGRLIEAWRRLRTFLNRSMSRGLRARLHREPTRKAEGIGVLCPAFSGGLEGDHLEWVRLERAHLIDLARLGLRAVTAGWRDDAAVEISPCRRGDIVSLGAIHATLDGEPVRFFSRVAIRYDGDGPRVIALDPEGT